MFWYDLRTLVCSCRYIDGVLLRHRPVFSIIYFTHFVILFLVRTTSLENNVDCFVHFHYDVEILICKKRY